MKNSKITKKSLSSFPRRAKKLNSQKIFKVILGRIVEFICQVFSADFKPYVKIRNQGIVRSEFRKLAQQFVGSDGFYKQRGRIEALFGEVKQALGSYERTKSFHIAVLFVLAKFVLFNLYAVFVVMIFQTLSFHILTLGK